MRYLTEAPSESPYQLVHWGVDTLLLNVRYADEHGFPSAEEVTPDYLIACLNAWKALAQEAEKPVPTPLTFQGAPLLIKPHGAGRGQWSWVLTCPAFNLTVSRGRLNGVVGQVRFSSAFLWSHQWPDQQQDIWTPIVAVEDFLCDFFQPSSDRLSLQVSELHLCADVAGWDVSSCEWRRAFLSRARTRIDRAEGSGLAAGGAPVAIAVGRKVATLEFGSHGSPLSCSIYNKSLEIRRSGKLWFQDLWRLHGWDGSSVVWRVEFRWRREALHEIKQEGVFHGIEQVEDLGYPGRLAYLWTYCAGHTQLTGRTQPDGENSIPDGWLRYALPIETETNLSRWPVHPAWSVVQLAFQEHTERAVNIHTGEVFELPASDLATLIRERHKEVNVRRLSQQIGGCASTLAAWLGGSMTDLVSVLDWLIEHLPAYALPELAKVAPLEQLHEEYGREFADKIAEKRAFYGLPDLAGSSSSVLAARRALPDALSSSDHFVTESEA